MKSMSSTRFSIVFALVGLLALGAHAQTTKVKEEKAKLVKLEKSYRDSKAKYVKTPKDEKVKKAYVDATVQFGTATMTAESLDRKVKYVGALRLYREALKIDPKNKEAKANKEMIESIYKSMGRPIPN